MLHFTNCGKVNSTFPLQGDADEEYNGTDVNVTIHEGIQEWIVPQTGFYLIEAAGASGTTSTPKYSPGKGVVLSSIFPLSQHSKLYILVGQQGYTHNINWGGSGGGATFIAEGVTKSDDILQLDNDIPVKLLLAAAGGGGSGDDSCSYATPEYNNGHNGICPNIPFEENSNIKSDGYDGSGYKNDSKKGSFITKSFLHGGKGIYYEYKTEAGNTEFGHGGFGGGGVGSNGGGGGGGYIGGKGGEAWNNKITTENPYPGGKGGYGGYSYSSKSVIQCKPKNEGAGYVYIHLINRHLTCEYKTRLSNLNPTLFAISLLFSSKTQDS